LPVRSQLFGKENKMELILPIVSFPKSGNTWVRFLLANALKRDTYKEVNFQNLDAFIPTNNTESYDRNLLREDAPVLVKRHYAFGSMSDFPYNKLIYIVRNGLDALWSYWHFSNAQTPGKYHSPEGFLRCYWASWGHWGNHITSWLFNKILSDIDIFVIKFEELIVNPHKILKECLDFLDINYDAERISAAVESSDKKKLKKMKHSDVFMKSQKEDFHFVRSGASGEGRDNMSEKAKNIFFSNPVNLKIMYHFGYIDTNDLNRSDIALKSEKLLSIPSPLLCRYYNFRYRVITRFRKAR
jgi:hypothetical protein